MRSHPTCVGKTFADGRLQVLCNGSPPRAWGRRIQIAGRAPLRRFTPTCVGKTRLPHARTRIVPVHPHVRGEDGNVHLPSLHLHGSPPRAWGRRDERHPERLRVRFTPTCVGKTEARQACTEASAVHPHVRGEDFWTGEPGRQGPVHPHVRGEDWLGTAFWLGTAGSPPRAWGRRLPDADEQMS